MSDPVQLKAKRIKLLILDVDGVLTDGIIYYGNAGAEMKGFHIHDGLGIKLLQKAGITVAVISGKKSEAVARRLQELDIQHVYLGYGDKQPAYSALKTLLNMSDDDIACIGDDLPDLPLLRQAGLAMTVPNAVPDLMQHVDYTTHHPGGQGAVREVCELLLKAQSLYEDVVKSYFN